MLSLYIIVALLTASVICVAILVDPTKKKMDYLLRDGWQILLLAVLWLPAFLFLLGVLLWSIRKEKRQGS